MMLWFQFQQYIKTYPRQTVLLLSFPWPRGNGFKPAYICVLVLHQMLSNHQRDARLLFALNVLALVCCSYMLGAVLCMKVHHSMPPLLILMAAESEQVVELFAYMNISEASSLHHWYGGYWLFCMEITGCKGSVDAARQGGYLQGSSKRNF